MLEMIQRQAQVDEVRWSRLQTELASSQNLSVMIFTTFTVVFLPLSFFTGLFGMNTLEWQEQVPSIKMVGAISLPASVLLIMAALVAAFSSRAQAVLKASFRHIKDVLRIGKSYVGKLEPESNKLAKKRQREEKKRARREDQARRRTDRGYDFWGVVKRERNSQYQIPDLNREIPGREGVSPKMTWLSA
jgi:CorA-like Mg2+ transporter protein